VRNELSTSAARGVLKTAYAAWLLEPRPPKRSSFKPCARVPKRAEHLRIGLWGLSEHLLSYACKMVLFCLFSAQVFSAKEVICRDSARHGNSRGEARRPVPAAQGGGEVEGVVWLNGPRAATPLARNPIGCARRLARVPA
jgi:hypothetical protein